MNALSSQESGGSYTASNASGAYGRFQILGSNWPAWSREALGDGVWEQTAANQDAVAKFKMLQYFDTWNDWDAVAIAWFAGPGRAERYVNGDLSVLNISDGGMSVRDYVAKMRAGMASGGAGVTSTGAGVQRYVPQFAPAVPAVTDGTEIRPQTFLRDGGILPPFTLNSFAEITAEVSNAVTGVPTLELTVDEASILSFQVADPQLEILKSGALSALTQLSFLDFYFEITAVGTVGDDSPSLDVKAMPLGLMFLKRATGALVMADSSPTDFALAEAQAAGLAFVGEPTESVTQISRSEPSGYAPGPDGKLPESSWDVLKAQAKSLGYACFVTGNTLYFGRQTWLLARPGVATWIVGYPTPASGELQLSAVPKARHSIEGNIWKTEIDLELDPVSGNSIRPGDRIVLHGVPTFESDGYLVTAVTITLDGGTPTHVHAVTPLELLPPAPPGYNGSAATDPAHPQAGSKRGTPSGVDDGSYVWPVQGTVTSGFGQRMAPGPGASTFHPGIDIGCPNGTPVVAARTGTVTHVGVYGGYGRSIWIVHADGAKTTYNHLQEYFVQEGEVVSQGQTIGLSNNTGTSFGPHLDFQIMPDGSTPADPLDFLPPA